MENPFSMAGEKGQIRIEVLGLSMRARHALKRAGVHAIWQVQGLTQEELLELRGVGPSIADEVHIALERYQEQGRDGGLVAPGPVPGSDSMWTALKLRGLLTYEVSLYELRISEPTRKSLGRAGVKTVNELVAAPVGAIEQVIAGGWHAKLEIALRLREFWGELPEGALVDVPATTGSSVDDEGAEYPWGTSGGPWIAATDHIDAMRERLTGSEVVEAASAVGLAIDSLPVPGMISRLLEAIEGMGQLDTLGELFRFYASRRKPGRLPSEFVMGIVGEIVGENVGRVLRGVTTVCGSRAADHSQVEVGLRLCDLAGLLFWSLSTRQIEVISRRYGLGDGQALTLQEIADMEGRSRERIRQIETTALRKLRWSGRGSMERVKQQLAAMLRPFVEMRGGAANVREMAGYIERERMGGPVCVERTLRFLLDVTGALVAYGDDVYGVEPTRKEEAVEGLVVALAEAVGKGRTLAETLIRIEEALPKEPGVDESGLIDLAITTGWLQEQNQDAVSTA